MSWQSLDTAIDFSLENFHSIDWMNIMKTLLSIFTVTALLVFPLANVNAQTVASEDFDGGAMNLLSSTVPTVEDGPGDSFTVGALAAWPTEGGTPFSLADNTVADVGDSTFFEFDNEGVFGMNSDVNNNFLGVSDSRDFGDVVATWEFDISSASTPLFFSIDAGSMEGSAFSYSTDTILRFEASIDGGATQTVFDIVADASGDGFSYRALDSGLVVVAGATDADGVPQASNALLATGDNAVTKISADTGSAAADQFLDKATAADGTLDTFETALNGTGNTLTITFTANVPFEAAAFDNLRVFTEGGGGDPLLGDVNLDGMVDFFDIQPFIDVLSDGSNQPEADIDMNGEVNFFDIAGFIGILSGTP